MPVIPYYDPQILKKLTEFDRLGGCIVFKLFESANTVNVYQTHFDVAVQTLLEVANDWDTYIKKVARRSNSDRNTFFRQDNNFNKLEKSGIKINGRDFFGPQLNLETRKLLVQGVEKFYNSRFYHDAGESIDNAVDFDTIERKFKFQETDGTSGAFCGAFLDPPHTQSWKNNP